MTDWTRALNTASVQLDKEEIRADLPIEYALAVELGVYLNEFGQARCPFHDDARPSFSVFLGADEVERAGCWSCEWRGDVFDVIQVARECTFGAAIKRAQEILEEVDEPVRRRRKQDHIDPALLYNAVVTAYHTAEKDLIPIKRVIIGRGLRMSAEWLHSNFRVGVSSTVGNGAICIPHFNLTDEFLGYKVRTASSATISAKGSRFKDLYGAWRFDGSKRVVLCEGESDTWTANWLLNNGIAFGLPTGTNTPIRNEWLTFLTGRQILIAFDEDDSGRDAADRWYNALQPFTDDVQRMKLPEGADVTSAPVQVVEEQLNG